MTAEIIRILPTDSLAVSLDTARRRLFIDADDDEFDEDLERLIRSATSMAEKRTGRILVPGEFECRFDDWTCDLRIPASPIRLITAVSYVDEAGSEMSVAEADWYADMDSRGATVRLSDSYSAPPLLDRADAVRIQFEAGYDEPEALGSDPAFHPDPCDAQMILMLVAHWFKNRDAVSDKPMSTVPLGFNDLVALRRIYS